MVCSSMIKLNTSRRYYRFDLHKKTSCSRHRPRYLLSDSRSGREAEKFSLTNVLAPISRYVMETSYRFYYSYSPKLINPWFHSQWKDRFVVLNTYYVLKGLNEI